LRGADRGDIAAGAGPEDDQIKLRAHFGHSLGEKVNSGDVLLSIEAMKMETAIHAERDGVLAEVLIKVGDQIDAKDLLIRYEA